MGIENTNGAFKIGEVVEYLGISADTLRYYEQIGLLASINRTPSGMRLYSERDLSRLCFIRRAKTMNITLDDIRILLEMRAAPCNARFSARALANDKLVEIERQIDQLDILRRELQLLVTNHDGSGAGCAAIEASVSDPNQDKVNSNLSKRG